MDGFDMGDGGSVVLMVVLWVGLLGAIVWALIRLFPRRGDAASSAAPLVPVRSGESPLDTLNRRLASGEIDVDTYSTIREAIEGAPSSADIRENGGSHELEADTLVEAPRWEGESDA